MRIATFNIENLDDAPIDPEDADREPSFEERAAILRPQLLRLRADILCLQEVHGQDVDEGPRRLRALETLLQGTPYAGYELRSTMLANGRDVERFRNLVTLIKPGMSFVQSREILHDFAPRPQYNYVTDPDEDRVRDITWERPVLYTEILTGDGTPIHVLNVHYKSKRPTNIAGQTFPRQTFKWRTSAGWAEGFFISSMKRVGAALETRIFVDQIITDNPGAHVVVCGDMNAETWEVPMQALRGEVADTQNPDLAAFTLYPCEETVPEDKRFSLYHHGQKNMLDHLLVSQSMICCYRGTEIHNEIVRDESVAFAFDKKFPSSDHAPVVAEFDLPAMPVA